MPPSHRSRSSSSSRLLLSHFLFLRLLSSPLPADPVTPPAAAVQLGEPRGHTGEVDISNTAPHPHPFCAHASVVLARRCWFPRVRCQWSCDHRVPSQVSTTQIENDRTEPRFQISRLLTHSSHSANSCLPVSGSCHKPEDVIQRYMEEVAAPPDEVKSPRFMAPAHSSPAEKVTSC